MGEVSWAAWRPDWETWAWTVWLAVFVVLESYTLLAGERQELTAHVRPVFLSHPLTWWLAFGAWVWLGLHFLAPRLEYMLLRWLRVF